MNYKNKIFGVYMRIIRTINYLYHTSFSSIWKSENLKVEVIGNKYGRGYYIPGLLRKEGIVYSFGIGEDVSFDLELLKNHDIRIVGFDPTPKSIDWVKNNHEIPGNFIFQEYGLSAKTGQLRFFLPENDSQVSASLTKDLGGGYIDCNFLTFQDTLERLGDSFVDLAKIDIEGEEYNLFKSWIDSEYIPPIGQIWVEFHPERAGFSNISTYKFVKSLEKISLVIAQNTVVKRTNHYLLVNRSVLSSKSCIQNK